MKIKFTKAVGGRTVGDEADVPDSVGKALVARGVAEVVATAEVTGPRRPRATKPSAK